MPRRREPFTGDTLPSPPYESSIHLEASAPALLLSDLHFGDGSRTDLFAGSDDRLIELLEDARREVETIVFLGDIIDMPQAWRIARVADAHPRLFHYLQDLVRRTRVVFVNGNHDWDVAYDAVFEGAERTEAVLFGERVLAWHGHQVDLLMNPGRADATPKTYAHALLERLVGTRLVPPLERFDSRANRVAMRAAVAFARLSLARASARRAVGRDGAAARLEAEVRYLARSVTGDPADIFGASCRTLLSGAFDVVVCGHTHVPGVARVDGGTYVNTGTWASGMRTVTRWDGARFTVRDIDRDHDIEDEYVGAAPARTEPADLFRWWARWRESRVA